MSALPIGDEGGSIMDELAAGTLSCPHCSETFDGKMGAARRAQHINRRHPEAAAPKASTEVRPGVAKAPAAKKKRTLRTIGRKTPAASKPTGERSPTTPRKPRVSLERLTQGAWGVLQYAANGLGYVPTSRALALESPIIGVAVDKALKGTIADRVLQPVARMAEAGSGIGALIVFPLAMNAIERNPAAADAITPVLLMCLDEMVPLMAEAIKREVNREAVRAEVFAELGPLFGKAPGEPCTAQDVLNWCLAPVPEPPSGDPPR